MSTTALNWLGRSLVVGAATVLLAACASEVTLGPDQQRAASPARATLASAAGPELGACDRLSAPAGSAINFHAYAQGVQIYRWSGTEWVLVGPSAVLYADAEGSAVVGTHYAGPRWQSVSGSVVKGAAMDRCVADPNSIPWLLLSATPESGAGVFQGTAFIQRVNTVGGKAPAAGGTVAGETTEVPYRAEYYFYRAP